MIDHGHFSRDTGVDEARAGARTAEADRVRARLDYHRGRAQLEYLIGTGLWFP